MSVPLGLQFFVTVQALAKLEELASGLFSVYFRDHDIVHFYAVQKE